MNTILTDQNRPEMIRLLRAQSVAYDQAKNVQFVELWAQVFSLVTPVIGILALPQTYERCAVLATTIFLVINGATFLLGKKKTDIAANIQEQFDTALFKLPWQPLSKGEKVPIDDIVKLAKDCRRTDLTDWYSNEITLNIRHSNAVLLCQDSNLIWDASLRKLFKNHFITFSIIYYTLFVSYLIYVDKSFTESLLILSPTFPFLLFSIITLYNVTDLIKEKRELSHEIK
ncbi:MAG: S-4TM family putative pore-forming effector, partial [Janthinobacterium sp.]